LEKPDLAKQIGELSAKEPKALDPNEVEAAFASDDPRIAELREKILAAVRAATRYAV